MNATNTEVAAITRQKSLDTLSHIRVLLRDPRNQNPAFKRSALAICSQIEAHGATDDLWSTCLEEAELTEYSRLGDHLAVTRGALGVCA